MWEEQEMSNESEKGHAARMALLPSLPLHSSWDKRDERKALFFLRISTGRGEEVQVCCVLLNEQHRSLYCICTHVRVPRARMRARVWIMSHMQRSRHCFPSLPSHSIWDRWELFWFSHFESEGQKKEEEGNFVCFRTCRSAANCSSAAFRTLAAVFFTLPAHCLCVHSNPH